MHEMINPQCKNFPNPKYIKRKKNRQHNAIPELFPYFVYIFKALE